MLCHLHTLKWYHSVMAAVIFASEVSRIGRLHCIHVNVCPGCHGDLMSWLSWWSGWHVHVHSVGNWWRSIQRKKKQIPGLCSVEHVIMNRLTFRHLVSLRPVGRAAQSRHFMWSSRQDHYMTPSQLTSLLCVIWDLSLTRPTLWNCTSSSVCITVQMCPL